MAALAITQYISYAKISGNNRFYNTQFCGTIMVTSEAKGNAFKPQMQKYIFHHSQVI